MTPLLIFAILFPALSFAYLFCLRRRMVRNGKNSIGAVADLLCNCRQSTSKGGRWRLKGTFRCREFDIFQLDSSAAPSIGSRCAVKLQCHCDFSLRICRRRFLALIRQILGDVQIPLRSKLLSKSISMVCSSRQFAKKFLSYDEYEVALEDVWASGKRRGTLHMRREAMVYATRWRGGSDFVEEIKLALGLMCDLHDFIRSRRWQSNQ